MERKKPTTELSGAERLSQLSEEARLEVEGSWARMKELTSEMGKNSRYMRLSGKKGIELRSEKGEEYTIAKIEDLDKKTIKKAAKEIRKFLSDFFEEEENDPEEDYVAAIEQRFSDFLAIRDEKGDIIAFMNSQLAETETAEGNPPEAELLVWYVVTNEKYRGKGLATELYRIAYERALKDAQEKGLKLTSIAGETDPDVEGFLNRMGRKRVYYENESGDLVEIPYKALPSDPEQKPSSEHFMLRFLDGRDEISTDEFLRSIGGVYAQYTRPEYFEYVPDDEKKAYYELAKKTFDKLQETLSHARDGKVYLLSAEEREAMKKEFKGTDKKIREIKP